MKTSSTPSLTSCHTSNLKVSLSFVLILCMSDMHIIEWQDITSGLFIDTAWEQFLSAPMLYLCKMFHWILIYSNCHFHSVSQCETITDIKSITTMLESFRLWDILCTGGTSSLIVALSLMSASYQNDQKSSLRGPWISTENGMEIWTVVVEMLSISNVKY